MRRPTAPPATAGIPGHTKSPGWSVQPGLPFIPCPQDGVDVVFTVASMQTGCK